MHRQGTVIFWRKVRHHSFTGVVLDTDASQPELATNFREGHINLTPQAIPVMELTKTDILRVLLFLEEPVALHYKDQVPNCFQPRFHHYMEWP